MFLEGETLLYILFTLIFVLGLACVWQLIRLASYQRDTRNILDQEVHALQQMFSRLHQQIESDARHDREELIRTVLQSSEALQQRMHEGARLQQDQIKILTEQLQHLSVTTEQRFDRLRETVHLRMDGMQQETSRHLDAIRGTVDEKLQATLEKRIGESFRLVSERLELVQKGLGEMQALAVGVGDLKRVLSNVKVRGVFGEVRLQALLEQILAPEQFELNSETVPGSNRRVEFAVRLPGHEVGRPVLLPIDAKFPQEAYLKIVEAQEQGGAEAVEEGLKSLEKAIRLAAADISTKYIEPPHTTDFAIMFLPTEGLYAEVVRRADLADELQRRYKVMIAGPTTLAALLNALQMGFRTLAIERRSAEVWHLLGAVRTEFSRFADLLERTRKKLQEAGNSIESAAVRTRQMERKLQHVQSLPEDQAAELLAMPLGDEHV